MNLFLIKEKLFNFFTKIPLAMRLILLFLIMFTGVSWAENTYAQNAKISIDAHNQTIANILENVEQQSEFSFIYDSRSVDTERKVSVRAENENIFDVLSQMFAGSDIAYTVVNKKIILNKKEEMLNLVQQQQGIPITGTVTDSNREPLSGVSIEVKGASQGTVTDANGAYNLTVPNENAVLVFSYVGFITQEIKVGNLKNINVKLNEDTQKIDEVVVVGYGTQKKVNLTGSVASVKGDRLINKAVTGTVDALQGVMPGVVVTKSTGSPGQEGYNIMIRGATSATNNPVLVLIDGIEADIKNVRPEDVESISVLKDAAAAAIYGAKAAGGVVLIKTKGGQAGKVSIEFNSYFTLSKLGRLPERISTYQAAMMRNEAEINSGGSALITEDDFKKLADPNYLWDANPSNPNEFRYWGNYNYADLILKPFTPMTSINLAISGGNEKTTYRISGTYFRNDGSIRIGYDFNEKYAGRVNLNTKINQYMELSTIFGYSNNKTKKPSVNQDGDYGLFAYIFTYPGITPLYDPNGHLAQGVRIGGNQFDGRIKFYDFDKQSGYRLWNENNMMGTSTLTIKNLVRGLQFGITGAINGDFNEQFFYRKQVDRYGIDNTVTGQLVASSNITQREAQRLFKEIRFQADYQLTVGKHNLSFLAGYSFQDWYDKWMEGFIGNLTNKNLPSFNWGDNTTRTISDYKTAVRFQSVFGRLNYNFNNRYLFEANFRNDGSSKLSPQNRYRLFPSFSAAWRIGEEKWFNVDFVNELKLRGSFGQLGNANSIGNFSYVPILSTKSDDPDNLILGVDGNGVPQRAQYVFQRTLASKNISWETVQTSNIGLDAGFLNNRLTFEFDKYVKRNKDMLAAVAYPSVMGIGVGTQNAGELKTWGWDLNLSWRDTRGKFSYWISANIDDAQNELIRYMGATVISAGTRNLIEGYPLNSIFGYKTDGLFQSEEEVKNHAFQNTQTGAGDVIYRDLNGDNVISAGKQTAEDHGDLVYLGNDAPRYNFGFNAGFTWKGFDFSMFLQGVGKRVSLLSNALIMPYYEAWFGPQKHNMDYWTPDNRGAYWPRLLIKGSRNFLPCDKWLQNAAYVRMKDIQIGYTLPNHRLSKLGVEKLRVYIAGHDIFEFTKTLAVIDPETPNKATWQYPFRRSYMVGINLNF